MDCAYALDLPVTALAPILETGRAVLLHSLSKGWLSPGTLGAAHLPHALDGIAFAIAAAVVLPMLPNRALDPFGLFNPFTLWRLVVVVMGLSAFGYVAQRLAGARYGLVIAGLAGGLVSATAAVAAMAHRSRSGAA